MRISLIPASLHTQTNTREETKEIGLDSKYPSRGAPMRGSSALRAPPAEYPHPAAAQRNCCEGDEEDAIASVGKEATRVR